jgi:Staphylococcal nuclease homologue
VAGRQLGCDEAAGTDRGRSIVCQEKDRDRYGRIVAICRASGEDLGAIRVREGFAWAFTRYSVDYVDQQEEARTANRGVHAHDCAPPWEWRANSERETASSAWPIGRLTSGPKPYTGVMPIASPSQGAIFSGGIGAFRAAVGKSYFSTPEK